MGMQIRDTMRCHFTPTRRKASGGEDVERPERSQTPLMGMETVLPSWETIRQLLKELKTEYHMTQQFHP